jgi:uncharacterized spore protein YtfJ
MTDAMPLESAPEPASFGDFTVGTFQATMDKFLATANVNAVYAKPVRQGDTVIINCSEVFAGLGFGVGEGSGEGKDGDEKGKASGAGGGGGGSTFARPVAVIVATPEGVTVRPVIDTTKIGLAALTTLGFMLATLARLQKGR